MEQVLNNDVPQNISSQSDCMCVSVYRIGSSIDTINDESCKQVSEQDLDPFRRRLFPVSPFNIIHITRCSIMAS